MNHIYTSIWNHALHSWVAIPESSSGSKNKVTNHKNKTVHSLVFAGLALFALSPLTAAIAQINCTANTCNSSSPSDTATATGSGVLLNLSAPDYSVTNPGTILNAENSAAINVQGNASLNSTSANSSAALSYWGGLIVFEKDVSVNAAGPSLHAEQESTIHVKGSVLQSINTGSGQRSNLYAMTYGFITIDGDFNASGNNGTGSSVIGAWINSGITIAGKATLIGGASKTASLVYADALSTISIGSLDATYHSTDTSVAGVLALDEGKINIQGDSIIRMQSGAAIQAAGASSQIDMGNVTIETHTTDAAVTRGIWGLDGGQVTVKKSNITLDGDQDYGLNAENEASLTMNGLATITLSGNNSVGALANSATISTPQGLNITTAGQSSDGIQVLNGGTITNSNGLNINVQGTPGTNTSAGCGIGAAICLAGNNSSLTSSGAGTISSTGHAIQLAAGADLQLDLSDVALRTSSSNLSLIDIDTVSGTSRINLTNSTATAGNNGAALLLNAENGSTVALTASGTQLFGDIKADAGSAVSVVLSNASYLKGAIDPVNLQISSNSQWDITASSELSHFSNAGVANFMPSASNMPQTLTVDQYAGGGSLGLHTYLNAGVGSSDLLEIAPAGTVTDTNTLRVLDTKGLGTLPSGNGVMVVKAENSATTDASFQLFGGSVAAGIYDYTLYKNSDGNWYLHALNPEPEPGAPQRPNYNGTVSSVVSLASIAQIYNNSSLGTWRERVGGMAYSDIEQLQTSRAVVSPLWARVLYEKGALDGGQRFQDLPGSSVYAPRVNYHMSFLQVGGDMYRKQTDSGAYQTAGAFLTLGEIKGDVSHFSGANGSRRAYAGTAKIKNTALGGYWTHLAPSGSYVDVVAQYTHHSLDGHGPAGTLDGKGHTVAASVEAGKVFALAQTDWKLVPQAQVSYSDVRLKNIHAKASEHVVGSYQFGGNDSLEVRLGVEARYKYTSQKPGQPQQGAWLRLDVLQETKGTNTATYIPASGTGDQPTFTSSRHGTSVDLVGGMDMPVGRATSLFSSAVYRHGLGSNKGHAWRAEVGLRWLF